MTKIEMAAHVIGGLQVGILQRGRSLDDILTGVKTMVNILEILIHEGPGDAEVDPETLRLLEPFSETMAKFGVTQADVDAALNG